MGISQPLIAQGLPPGTKKVNEQLLSRDFNPLVKQPMTAYGQAFSFIKSFSFSSSPLTIPPKKIYIYPLQYETILA